MDVLLSPIIEHTLWLIAKQRVPTQTIFVYVPGCVSQPHALDLA